MPSGILPVVGLIATSLQKNLFCIPLTYNYINLAQNKMLLISVRSAASGWLIPFKKRVKMEDELMQLASEGKLIVSGSREHSLTVPFAR